MNNDSYKVLLDFDALMDTRLATIATISTDAANILGQSKEYYERYSDDIESIDSSIENSKFKDRYLKRNKNILQYCLATDVLHLIALGFESMMPNIHRGIIPKDARLIINTYPYKLDDNERRLIENSVLNHIPFEVSVETTYIDLYSLTPGYLSSTFKEWYTYDIENWLAIHQDSILKKPIISVNIILPKLSTSGNDPLAEKFDIEPFAARELLFKPYMNLNYIDLKYFTYNHAFTEHIKESGFYDRLS